MKRAAAGRMLAFCMLLSCTPSSVAEAEKKRNVSWLVASGTPEAIAALGRVADDDASAQEELERLTHATLTGVLDGGAGALDVYLAVWAGVERNATWAIEITKRTLADDARMNDMATAMKRGSPQLAAFVTDLDAALVRGCDTKCGAALASVDGPAAASAVQKRLEDPKTRDTMCFGVGSAESSKAARDVFMKAPATSRDAVQCTGAAPAIAARDDAALAWLATTAEPGLLRNVSPSMPCDRMSKLWGKVLVSRDHATFGALTRSLEDSVRQCPKELDAALAGALGADADSQTLVLASLGASNAKDLKMTCAAAPAAAQRVTAILARANARDFLARCPRAQP